MKKKRIENAKRHYRKKLPFSCIQIFYHLNNLLHFFRIFLPTFVEESFSNRQEIRTYLRWFRRPKQSAEMTYRSSCWWRGQKFRPPHWLTNADMAHKPLTCPIFSCSCGHELLHFFQLFWYFLNDRKYRKSVLINSLKNLTETYFQSLISLLISC